MWSSLFNCFICICLCLSVCLFRFVCTRSVLTSTIHILKWLFFFSWANTNHFHVFSAHCHPKKIYYIIVHIYLCIVFSVSVCLSPWIFCILVCVVRSLVLPRPIKPSVICTHQRLFACAQNSDRPTKPPNNKHSTQNFWQSARDRTTIQNQLAERFVFCHVHSMTDTLSLKNKNKITQRNEMVMRCSVLSHLLYVECVRAWIGELCIHYLRI